MVSPDRPRTPTIKVQLDDGTNTWVTVSPINVDSWVEGQEFYGAERATGEAFSMFLGSLIRDREAVSAHLSTFRKPRG